ncbi:MULTISPECIES: MFS transporter [Sphingomonas]|nr:MULTISPECIES: MFS transporter [Sphingomonas]
MIAPRWYRDLDPNGRRAFRSTYAGFSMDAMNVQLYSFILPLLLTLWQLSPAAGGLLATVMLVASAAGGWLAGLASDRFGRVRVLQVAIVWMALSTLCCGLAQNFEQLLVARTLQGFGFGAEWAVGAVYMGEIASAATRGRLVGTAQSAWAIGWGLAAATSTIAVALLPPELGWRAAFFVSLPPALAIFVARRRLAESATSSPPRMSRRGIGSSRAECAATPPGAACSRSGRTAAIGRSPPGGRRCCGSSAA